MNKFRTMYIGRAGLFVCTGVACLAINTERKKEAKQLADAAKAAGKKALQEMRFLPLAGHSWRHCRQEPGFDSPWRCGGGTASLLERAPVVVEPFFRCCVAAGQVNSPPPFHPISPP